MGEAGVATLVFSSSGDGLRPAATTCRSRRMRRCVPHSVYGRTKRVVEDFLRDLARANANWRIAILRCFNPAGAHASGMLGEVAARPALGPRAAARARSRPASSASCTSAATTGRRRTAPACATTFTCRTWRRAHVRALRAPRDGARRVDAQPRHAAPATRCWKSSRRSSARAAVGIGKLEAPRRPGDVAAMLRRYRRIAEKLLGWRATRDLDAICADAWRWQKNGGRY